MKRRAPWVLLVLALVPTVAHSDEGGVSFWLPGNYGSFAALPSEPGWSVALLYYYGSAGQSGDRTFTRGSRLIAGTEGVTSCLFVCPNWVMASPIAGAQASLGLAVAVGSVSCDIDATLSAPNSGAISGAESDSRGGMISDLYPTFTLKWGRGVHNYMAYSMAGVPTGTYDVERLANMGLNHGSIDFGGGYTFFDEQAGHELSAAAGITWNFENPATDYRSGTSLHLDWATSRSLSEAWQAGLVGYAYQQITGDSGDGAVLGDFKSRVFGVGPQVGWFFELAQRECYLNLKGYGEFGAENRPAGWNAWLMLDVPLGAPAEAKPQN